MGSPNVGENWALPISQPWVRYTSLLDRRRNLRARNKEQNLLRILQGSSHPGMRTFHVASWPRV